MSKWTLDDLQDMGYRLMPNGDWARIEDEEEEKPSKPPAKPEKPRPPGAPPKEEEEEEKPETGKVYRKSGYTGRGSTGGVYNPSGRVNSDIGLGRIAWRIT